MTGVSDIVFVLESTRWLLFCRHLRMFFLRMTRCVLGLPFAQTRFVILSHPRTGSNLLCDKLSTHPEIVMHNELFNEVHPYTSQPVLLFPWNVHERDRNPQGFLNHVFRAPINKNYQAVGFKSFPGQWLGRFDTFKRLIADPELKIIVLRRCNPVAVLVSMRRAVITDQYIGHGTNYNNVIVSVKPFELQRTVDKLNACYLMYDQLIHADQLEITYTELTRNPVFVSALLCDFLGVTYKHLRLPDHVKLPQSNGCPRDGIQPNENLLLGFAFRHTPIAHFLPETKSNQKALQTFGMASANVQVQYSPPQGIQYWNIILPICSKGKGNPWERLEAFATSVCKTTTDQERKTLLFTVGIDIGDPVFDLDDAKSRISRLFSNVVFVQFEHQIAGEVCTMWNRLTKARSNADLFVLLGDDVTLHTPGWKTHIEHLFTIIARRTGLAFGDAAVAFQDKTCVGFPTFPVVHRRHLERFSGVVLPEQFKNQDGDSFIFELYRRFGAAEFAGKTNLQNGIGGVNLPRYTRKTIQWKGSILHKALIALEKHMGRPRLLSIDVVIPTFRCPVAVLRRIISLRTSIPAAIRFIIIIDNPTHPSAAVVKTLQTPWKVNFGVTVIEMPQNIGASGARNRGMDESNSEHILFLDDDIEPSDDLIDAYLGAIMRFPNACAYVGKTAFPAPMSFWTHAVTATQLPYFFGVASKMNRPSWGVTANLCVRRVLPGSRVHRFKCIFPKTGGGEDIDFCWQLSGAISQNGLTPVTGQGVGIVAVPGAVVSHPWWNNGKSCINHILGWTAGETLLLDEWPTKTYRVMPTWCEIILVLAVTMIPYQPWDFLVAVCALTWVELFIFSTYACFEHTNQYLNSIFYRILISWGGAIILAAQQVWRMVHHLRRGRLYNLCRRVDWFDGRRPQWQRKNQWEAFFRAVIHLIVLTWTFGWLK